MRTLVLHQGGRFLLDLPHNAISTALKGAGAILWLDVADPTREDQLLLSEQFGFHPLSIEDAIRSHERPKVDTYGVPGDADGDGMPDEAEPQPEKTASPLTETAAELGEGASLVGIGEAPPPPDAGADELDEMLLIPSAAIPLAQGAAEEENRALAGYYFVVFYAAAYDPGEDRIGTHPVNLFIGPNYLVTVHSGSVAHITETLARWRAPRSPLESRIGALVHALLDAMVDDYFPLMDRVADRVEDLEDSIFIKFSEGSIQTMFRLKKDLLAMRRVVAPERDVLNVLLRRQLPIFTSQDVAYLQDVYDHIVRVTDNIDTYRDLLSSAVDSYLSLQSNKLNQIMKLLTIASIILMSDALITGFYGQNFRLFPELNWPTGSFWSLILMVVVDVALVIYFLRKKWL